MLGEFPFPNHLLPWVFMWILALAIYAVLKWLSWLRVQSCIPHSIWRSAAYLLAWPGMDAESFLNRDLRATPPRRVEWYRAIIQTLLGVLILWGVARTISESYPLLRGWAGMVGAVLVLHFGTFRIAALIWQKLGIKAEPIMAAPLWARSLSEFWGKRWNLGFRQLAYDLVFAPLHKKLGTGAAGFIVFVASGLVHDFVISLPARGGYGLPTAYFVIQGAGVAAERSNLGRRLGLRRGVRGWLFMAALTASPAFLLFHPPFIRHVIIPMMHAIHSL